MHQERVANGRGGLGSGDAGVPPGVRGGGGGVAADRAAAAARSAAGDQRPAGVDERRRRPGHGRRGPLDSGARAADPVPGLSADRRGGAAGDDLPPWRRVGMGVGRHARPAVPGIRGRLGVRGGERGLRAVARSRVPAGDRGMCGRGAVDRGAWRHVGARSQADRAGRGQRGGQPGAGHGADAARWRWAGAAGRAGAVSGVRCGLHARKLRGVRRRGIFPHAREDAVLLGRLRAGGRDAAQSPGVPAKGRPERAPAGHGAAGRAGRAAGRGAGAGCQAAGGRGADDVRGGHGRDPRLPAGKRQGFEGQGGDRDRRAVDPGRR